MDVARECEAALDPRVRRTRHGLQEALRKLLQSRSFEQISVLEIAEAAQVNRATFYDHYSDKFALLESLVAARFFALLEGRNIRFDGTCPSALKALVLAVYDFLMAESAFADQSHGSSFQSVVESAVISLIRKVLLDGPDHGPEEAEGIRELRAAAASWAIYGASREWAETGSRLSSDEMAGTIVNLVSPLLGFPVSAPEPHPLLK